MKRTWKDWLGATILALCLSFTIAPDSGADALSDQEIEAAAAKHGADAGEMKRVRKCETPSGGPNAFQVKDIGGRPTDEAGRLDWAAQQFAAGRAKKHWVVCTGGGKAKGRSAPVVRTVTCVSHAEWQGEGAETHWQVVTFTAKGKCPLPEPPDWHVTPQVWKAGCGWNGLETDDPKWMCSQRTLGGSVRV